MNRPPFHIADFISHEETPVVLTELSLSACCCNVPMLQLRLWLPRLHGTWQAVVALAWWLPIMAVHCLQLLTSPRHAAARRHGEMVHLVSSWKSVLLPEVIHCLNLNYITYGWILEITKLMFRYLLYVMDQWHHQSSAATIICMYF